MEKTGLYVGTPEAMDILEGGGAKVDRKKKIAKFLVLTGIDRLLMSLFKERADPLYLIGTSIGAFRMAAYCQRDPLEALGRLEKEYIAQQYDSRPTRKAVTGESWRILHAYIEDDEVEHILNHPFMRINFLANKCKGPLKSENLLLQGLGVALAAGANRVNRDGAFLV